MADLTTVASATTSHRRTCCCTLIKRRPAIARPAPGGKTRVVLPRGITGRPLPARLLKKRNLVPSISIRFQRKASLPFLPPDPPRAARSATVPVALLAAPDPPPVADSPPRIPHARPPSPSPSLPPMRHPSALQQAT
ncbi:hypothetical protein GQ55_3G294200 [Panicum hallii var. hallii]|uniref:Uncharacterized protein n=1 Tax=Panicum hallii var. hallii TaxID=1504633 RepID=A0A2T7EEL6_9POAL|nr:hypothetical protein GQ55_3G294200 [Panicum hallii var. hallii]